MTISVLSQMNKPKYGYALVQSLEEKGVAIDPNTQVYEQMKIYWKNLSAGIERLLEEEEA